MKTSVFNKFHSIRNQIIIPLIVSFLFSTYIITSLVFYHNNKIIKEVLLQLRNEILNLVEYNLNNKLYEVMQLNSINSDFLKNEIFSLEDAKGRERYFYSLIKNFDDVAMTYIGLPSGEFYGARRNPDGTYNIVKNNKETKGNSEYYSINEKGEGLEKIQVFENFDPRLRPWYKTALNNNSMSFSSIYSHFVFKEPTLTASIPIYKNSELLGIFGVDFLMTWLNNILRNLPIGKNGQVFIIDENNNLVASTTGEDIFTIKDGKSQNMKVEDSKNFLTKSVVLNYKEGIDEIKINKNKYLVAKDTYLLNGIQWEIYTVILRDDFLGNMDLLILQAVLSILLLTFVFILMMLVITERIVKPILRLNERAKQLTLGAYEKLPSVKEKNEIYELTESFNIMGEKLTNLLNHLAQEVRKRTQELEQKNKILKKYSYLDELMEIPNRRKFDEFIVEAMDLSSRNHRPIGLIMIDIDNFKGFNDTYGHIAGDNCLKKVGHIVKSSVKRKTDLVARYGGEELIVVLRELNYSSAIQIAEEIRKNIEDMKIENNKAPSGYVTISMGLVFGQISSTQTPEELIELADELMYTAKKRGKNRLESMEL